MNLSNMYHQTLLDLFNAINKAALNHLTVNPVLAPGGTATNFQLSAFSYMLAGIVYNKAAANNIAPPGFSTGAGEYRKVLICVDASGTVSTVAGEVADSQEEAALPATPDAKLGIGYLELAPAFTSGSTNVTAGMCKPFVHAIDN